MAKETKKVLYASTDNGNDNVVAEILYVQGMATVIKANEQVMVEPYVKDLLMETKDNAKKANKKNEQMSDHKYI